MQKPKELLEQLCRDADPRKIRSLKLIYGICHEQNERGSKDYSVATIGKLSSERGGPGPGAIRNPTGEVYRVLIQAFAESVGGDKKKNQGKDNDSADQILEGMNDPLLRTRIQLLLADLESTRGQLNAARRLANQNATLQLDTKAKTGDTAGATPAPRALFSESELRTLRKAISKETLDHWGWKVDDAGRVITESGQHVFGPGFVTALNKVIGAIEKSGDIILLSSK